MDEIKQSKHFFQHFKEKRFKQTKAEFAKETANKKRCPCK